MATSTTTTTTATATTTTMERPADCIRSLRKLRFDSLDTIRSIYRRATKAFLLNQHAQVWAAILLGLERIDELLLPRPTHSPWWLISTHPHSSIDATLDHELLQLDRKFQILKITFLTASLQSAHVHQHAFLSNSPAASIPFSELSPEQHGLLSQFLQLNDNPHQFLIHLISSIIPSQHSPIALPPPNLHQIHPSILTALGLASIKLSIPQTGKEIIEAWFSAIEPFQLNFTTTTTTPSSSSANTSLTADLKLSYQNLIQIYSIHILGALNQWQFANDFIHSHLSAEILPPETVESILEAIKAARVHQSQAIKQSLQRQHQRREETIRQSHNQQTRKGATQERCRAKYSSGSSAGMSAATTTTDLGPCSPTVAVGSRRPSLALPTSPAGSIGGGGYSGFRSHLARVAAPPVHPPKHPGPSPNPALLPRLKIIFASLRTSPPPVLSKRLATLLALLLSSFFLKPSLAKLSPLSRHLSSSSLLLLLRAFAYKLARLLSLLGSHLP